MLYDKMLMLRSRMHPIPAQVCVVYMPDRDVDVSFHVALTKKLKELGARSAAYIDVDPPSERELADHGAPLDFLFFPLHQAAESAEQSQSDHHGSINLLPTESGIYRQHYGIGDRSTESIEWKVAKYLLVKPGALPSNAKRFDILYRGSADSLPNVAAEKVVDGTIVESLFKGKAVVIGRPLGQGDLGLVVPTSNNSAVMSRVEMHGHCLNGLLNEATVRRPGYIARAISYGSCLVILFVVVHRSAYRRMWLNIVICLLVVAVVCWVSLTFYKYRLPAVGMLLSQCLVVFTSLAIRFHNSKRTLEHLEIGKTDRLEIESMEEFWEAAGTFIYQFFYFLRLTIFELPPGSNYLKIVHSANCDKDAIAEQRRDFRRAPYCDAAELHQPLDINVKKTFFVGPSADEKQIMAPLVFGDKVIGFIAAGVHTNAYNRPEFKSRLQAIADDVAAAVEQLRKRLSNAPDSGMQLYPEQTQLKRILAREQEALHQQRRLEEIVEEGSTASATFDIYGRPLVVNRRMRDHLKDRGVVLSDITTLQTIQELSLHDWNDCRRLLRRVVFDNVAETIVVTADEHDGGLAVLHIRPINDSHTQRSATASACNPFCLSGIQIEYTNEHAWQTVIEDRQRIVRQLCSSMFEAIEGLRHAADGESSDVDDFDRFLETATQDLRACQEFLATHRELSAQANLPVGFASLVESVVENAQHDAEVRGLLVEVEHLDESTTVLANPQCCSHIVETLLGLTLRDAKDHSQVLIGFEVNADTVTLTIQNSHLVEYLESGENHGGLANVISEEVLDFQRWVTAWGGKLDVSQIIGIGLRVNLCLRTHSWGIAQIENAVQSAH